jgi:hypothetical protein
VILLKEPRRMHQFGAEPLGSPGKILHLPPRLSVESDVQLRQRGRGLRAAPAGILCLAPTSR